MVNDVVAWLESPEGEDWSFARHGMRDGYVIARAIFADVRVPPSRTYEIDPVSEWPEPDRLAIAELRSCP